MIHSKRVRRAVVSALLMLPTLAVPASSAGATASRSPLKVMSQNLYVGGDLASLLDVSSFPELVGAVTALYETVQRTNFPERAQVLADEIAATMPHIVGLQEVALWRTQTPADFLPLNASDVRFDFLQLLLDALAERGARYEPVAIATNLDVEAPRSSPETGFQDIRLTDRDVILARTDLPAGVLSVARPQASNFVHNLELEGPLFGGVVIPRGWTAVDVTLQGRTIRLINTHLERNGPDVQIAQAAELIAGPANTALPVVLLGDLNSAAGAGGVPGESATPTYRNMLAAGFRDVWTVTHASEPGFTCCQREGLSNPVPSLTERIDVVLTEGALTAVAARRVGATPNERTPSGLWPSDHAGLWAAVRIG